MADDEETRDAAAPAAPPPPPPAAAADAPPAAADDGEGALDAAGAARLAAHDPALTWAHDVISAGPGDNADACCRVLGKYLGEPAGLKIADASLRGFVDDIRKRMSTAWVDLVPPYHNFNHGTDVLLQVAQYALVFGAAELLTPLDVLGLGVAALGHDVSHPGLNNAFQVNSASELALRYADVAVLEAHSAAVVGTLVRDRQLLLGLSDKDFRRCRLIICASILGTDMSTHFKTMERLTKFNDAAPWTAEGGGAAKRDALEAEERKFVCDVLLHTADVSNPARPWDLCKKWSDLVMDEFFRQGDKEALLGLPISPNCNRASTSQAGCSIGFSDFIVKPLFCQVARMLPGLEGTAVACLASNREKWVDAKDAEASAAAAPAAGAPEDGAKREDTAFDAAGDESPGGARLGDDGAATTVRKRRTKLMDQGNLAAGLNSTKKKRAFGDSFHKRSHRPRPWAMGHMGSVSHSVSHGLGALSRLGGFGHGGDEKHDHDDVEEGKASLLPLETDRGDDGSDAGASTPWAAFDACLDGLAKLYHTNQIQTLFFVMTILTLVGNSIRHAYLRPRADFGVDVTLTAFLGLFAIEIALLSLKEPGYWGSVFMAFDVLGAASIVLDVPWLQGGRGSPLMESSSARGTTRTARAVRLIRFMRFVRLVRMAKLMKFLDCFSDAKEEDASEAAQVDAGGSARAAMGTRLAEKISRQMLLVVLVVLLVTPYLDAEPNAYKPQREILEAMGNMTHAQRSAFVDHSYARRFDVLYLRIAGYDYVPKKDHVLDNLRYGETVTYKIDYGGPMLGPDFFASKTKVIQSRRQVVKLEAFYDLLLIIFISLLVVVSSWSFNEVAEDIVVRPVADMLRVVSKVGRSLDMLKRDAQQAEYETDFLEHSIGKISELLRLGFGTTDALLGDGGGATLAVEGATAIESVRIQAAFAFLDIHNLTLNNNHVKSDVVFSYVSVVAHLVRSALDRYRGGEARNAANSFLLVWRSRKSELEAPEVAAAPAGDRPGWGGLSYDDLPEVSCCDAAFKALVRTALDVAHVNAVSPKHKELVSALAACDFRGSEDDDPHRNSKLRRAVSGIAQRLSTETKRAGLSFHAPSRARHAAISRVVAKMDKYGTAIVFASGLHFGHAIENRPAGSAGDDYADCTFMSPHVNLAARLELAASAVYGVTMLMSGPFVSQLAPATRATVRQIDRAKLKGADASTTLHTYDFLPAEPERWLEAQGVLGHSELTALFDFDSKGDCDAYLASFSRGRAAYLEGNWALAYDLLQPLMERQSDDAPLSAVVNFMASNGNICPPDWRGYRNL